MQQNSCISSSRFSIDVNTCKRMQKYKTPCGEAEAGSTLSGLLHVTVALIKRSVLIDLYTIQNTKYPTEHSSHNTYTQNTNIARYIQYTR